MELLSVKDLLNARNEIKRLWSEVMGIRSPSTFYHDGKTPIDVQDAYERFSESAKEDDELMMRYATIGYDFISANGVSNNATLHHALTLATNDNLTVTQRFMMLEAAREYLFPLYIAELNAREAQR